MQKQLKAALIVCAVAATGVSTPALATTLTFDIAGGVSNFENMPQSYGDNVTSSPDGLGHAYGVGAEGFTPNVAVNYGTPGEDPALWTTGYGDLTNIYFNDADGDTTLTLNFLASAGYTADLYGFDLASFLPGGQTIQGLKVINATTNAVLFSAGSTFITGATRNTYSFGTALSANNLSLIVDLTGLGGVSDDIGVDNVRFGQTLVPVTPPGAVPEPATWMMMLAGFGIAGTAMRRRQRKIVPQFA